MRAESVLKESGWRRWIAVSVGGPGEAMRIPPSSMPWDRHGLLGAGEAPSPTGGKRNLVRILVRGRRGCDNGCTPGPAGGCGLLDGFRAFDGRVNCPTRTLFATRKRRRCWPQKSILGISWSAPRERSPAWRTSCAHPKIGRAPASAPSK